MEPVYIQAPLSGIGNEVGHDQTKLIAVASYLMIGFVCAAYWFFERMFDWEHDYRPYAVASILLALLQYFLWS